MLQPFAFILAWVFGSPTDNGWYFSLSGIEGGTRYIKCGSRNSRSAKHARRMPSHLRVSLQFQQGFAASRCLPLESLLRPVMFTDATGLALVLARLIARDGGARHLDVQDGGAVQLDV